MFSYYRMCSLAIKVCKAKMEEVMAAVAAKVDSALAAGVFL